MRGGPRRVSRAVPRPRRPRAAPGAPVVVRRRLGRTTGWRGARGVRDAAAVGAGVVAAGVSYCCACLRRRSLARTAKRLARMPGSRGPKVALNLHCDRMHAPSTRRAVRSVSSSVDTASRRLSSASSRSSVRSAAVMLASFVASGMARIAARRGPVGRRRRRNL